MRQFFHATHDAVNAFSVIAPDDDYELHARIRAEYEEMPGLRLTVGQAARLFATDSVRCARVLDSLVRTRFLSKREQLFARRFS